MNTQICHKLLSRNVGRVFSTQIQQTCREIRFPGPYGEIAGKWWGPRDKRPILAIHGWQVKKTKSFQENAGTFDTLAPLLSPHIGVLAIDMPGHGLSSRLPPGTFYHSLNEVMLLRRIVEYFGWAKVSLLGHSLGAIQCYFHRLDFLICMDNLHSVYIKRQKPIEYMVQTVESFLKYDELERSKSNPPTYSFQEIKELLHYGTKQSIDLNCCKYLLQRNIAPSIDDPNRYYFTRDQKLKVEVLASWSEDLILEGTERISCPLFFCLAKGSPFVQFRDKFEKLLDIIKKKNDVDYHLVDGTHHFHLNAPEGIALLMNDFIDKYDVCDRTVHKNYEDIVV